MPKSLPGHELLPPSSLLSLTDVQQQGTDVHTLNDLPALGVGVSLRIRMGRWRRGRPRAIRVFAVRLQFSATRHQRSRGTRTHFHAE
jgi:hypothetical protein